MFIKLRTQLHRYIRLQINIAGVVVIACLTLNNPAFGAPATAAPLVNPQGNLVVKGEQPMQPSALSSIYGREKIDLNGKWRYQIDPLRNVRNHWKNSYRLYEDRLAGPSVDRDLFEYDFAQSPEFIVPGDWNSQISELSWYNSMVWFRRHETLKKQKHQRYHLYFEAVNYVAYVYVNGKSIGAHEGGFTPFAFDITDQLVDGENSIVVGVDATHDHLSIPSTITDWKNYGGITRPVYLIKTPATYIHSFHAGLNATRDKIHGEIQLAGPKLAGQKVSLHITELGIKQILKSDKQGRVTFEVIAPENLQLWHPNHPKLYDVDLSYKNDHLVEKIGFRTIETRGRDILLNGEKIFLRGISLHEESLGSNPTRALTWDSAGALLRLAKQDLNANFVRLAHYPHSEKMTRLADELGLLVWSEVPVYWGIAFDNSDVLNKAKQQLQDNIQRDINRASVIIWSVANETPDSPARIHFLTELVNLVRSLDNSRLVSAAMNSYKLENSVIEPNDVLASQLDLIAVNTYEGWYGDKVLDQVKALKWHIPFEKPLIFSELGAGAKKGFYDADRKQKFSEEYQEDYYRATIEMAKNISVLSGVSPWILKDFKSPIRYHSVYQNYWNRKGLVSPEGEPKKAFFVLKQWFDELEQQQKNK